MELSHISNKDSFFQSFSLSDVEVIRLLVEHRHKYDENFYLNIDSTFTVTGASPVNQELIALFADLDRLIEAAQLSPIQHRIIKLLQEGYTYDEIGVLASINRDTLTNRFRTIYSAIKKENDRAWRKCIYSNKLNLKTKRCSHCKEYLPATDEFFSVDEGKLDMYNSRCKKCRNRIGRVKRKRVS